MNLRNKVFFVSYFIFLLKWAFIDFDLLFVLVTQKKERKSQIAFISRPDLI